jgi:hypothetical protein
VQVLCNHLQDALHTIRCMMDILDPFSKEREELKRDANNIESLIRRYGDEAE